jgi:hypothetical protein
MSPGDIEREIVLRHNLLNTLQGCPLDTCQPEDCLLCQVATMDQSARVRWLDGFGLESLQFIASYQFICCEHKLAVWTRQHRT